MMTVFKITLALFLFATAAIAAGDTCYLEVKDFNRYLGLAVPVPTEIPELTIEKPMFCPIVRGRYRAELIIDRDGRTKKLKYPSDSAQNYTPLLKVYKKIKFNFTDGKQLGKKIKIPIDLEIYRENGPAKHARLIFPVSSEMVSDSGLLSQFWKENKIEPPRLQSIDPISYRVSSTEPPSEHQTITALVSLDDTGELLDLTYPIKGQDQNTHYIQIPLIYAIFRPARVDGENIPSQFLMTFRIFNNLNYPIDILAQPDSGQEFSITRKNFCTVYFNERDMAINPLPHDWPYGQLYYGKTPPGVHGSYTASFTIDETGLIGNIETPQQSGLASAEVKKFLRTFSWYPAYNACGEPVAFRGTMKLIFEPASIIVYIPDWLDF